MVRQLPSTLNNLDSILAIADAVPVMIAFCDMDQVYRFCNQPIADWFERPRDEIIGKTLRQVMGEKAYASRKDGIARAFAGEKQWVTAEFDHPTRGPLVTQAEYIPHYDARGEQVGVVMVVRDVTEQQAAEAAMKESEERFRRIADFAPVMMWVSRVDGHREFANRAYKDFFGLSDEQAANHDWRAAIHPDDVEEMIEEFEARRRVGTPIESMGRYCRADGEWRWLRSVSLPREGPDGEIIGYIGASTDVHETKLAEAALKAEVSESNEALRIAEDQLRQSQKMEALGQLTGGIAHDFNNLLTVVVGGLDFIVKGTTDERMLRYAKAAQSAADRGARLTAQLLAFSRVQRLSVEPTPINRSIEEMQPFLRNVLNPGIDKEIILLDEEVHVLADPTQLEVALLNLAINARDAMPDGGRLTIAAQRRNSPSDSELEEGDYVEILIGDTGEGMSKETLARAFDPFFTTKAVGKGTGLGLSMVYGMAHQSGGTVLLDSVEGEGTQVRLLLKVAESELDLGAPVDSRAADPIDHDASILVVDDDEDVRVFIVNSLREAGFSVREASSGAEALQLYDAEPADIVLLDYLMPEMTGADVAAALSTRRKGQPILFVSGYSDTEEIAAASPGAPILTKPFKAEDLVAAVSRFTPAKAD